MNELDRQPELMARIKSLDLMTQIHFNHLRIGLH